MSERRSGTLILDARSSAPIDLHAQPAMERRRWPSWLASLALHAALMSALALVVRSEAQPVASEPDRPAAIVLAQRQAGGEVEYFSEADAARQQRVEPSEQKPDNGLPSLAAAAELVDAVLDLPGAAAPASGLSDLLAGPGLAVARQPQGVASGGEASILADDAILNAPPGPSGPVAEVSLFGAQGAGRSFVFVIDRSQSMGPLLAAAERELKRALAPLTAEHRFQIIGYNHTLAYLQAKAMAEATPENKEQAVRFLALLAPVGGTNHHSALLAALRQQPDVVFFLTDADPPLGPNQIREITVNAGRRAAIHCIHVGYGAVGDDDTFMHKLARLNRGTFTYIDLTKKRP